MISKNPFDYPGLQIKLKGGSRQLADAQFRYAQAVGKEKKFGFKVTGGYFRALDWEATDTVANLYGDIEAEVNVSKIVRELQYDEDPETAADFRGLNAWLDFFPVALPGYVDVEAPGYLEEHLADNTTESLKLGLMAAYKINKDSELSYSYKFGRGTAIYQGSNRYSVNNILFHQHKVQYTMKGLTVKYYSTIENAGDSYDATFTAAALNGVWKDKQSWYNDYTDTFSQTKLGGGTDAQAHTPARQFADTGLLIPGTPEFEAAKKTVTGKNINAALDGSKFQDATKLYHAEGMYNFKADIAILLNITPDHLDWYDFNMDCYFNLKKGR